MNQEADATLNNEGAGESSAPMQAGGLVSTTEFITTPAPSADADPEGANKAEGTDKGSEGQEKAGATADDETKDGETTDGKPSGEDDRFDKHPRFQELRTRAETAEKRTAKLESQVEKLLEGKSPKGKEKEEPTFKDVSKMTNEELLDFQSEDPHAYYKNVLAQAKHELGADFDSKLEKKSSEDAIVSTYQDFAEKNPEFDTLWDQGKIKAYMEDNPGHNAISAYYMLTSEKSTQDAIDAAVKSAEEKFVANQRAKRKSKPLSSGPQTTGTKDAPVDAQLQDTKKFGGVTRVLADRLKARRQNQAAI